MYTYRFGLQWGQGLQPVINLLHAPCEMYELENWKRYDVSSMLKGSFLTTNKWCLDYFFPGVIHVKFKVKSSKHCFADQRSLETNCCNMILSHCKTMQWIRRDLLPLVYRINSFLRRRRPYVQIYWGFVKHKENTGLFFVRCFHM